MHAYVFVVFMVYCAVCAIAVFTNVDIGLLCIHLFICKAASLLINLLTYVLTYLIDEIEAVVDEGVVTAI